jgi:vitamin B12 transporter
MKSSFTSRLLKADWQNNLHFPLHTVTVGLEAEEEKGESDFYSESQWGPYESSFREKRLWVIAGYIQDHIKLWNRLFATIGGRTDYHESFGSRGTYRLGSSYLFTKIGTKIKATLGTGFKAPSLYQLYSEYGDLDLRPEKSFGWDAGLEQLIWKNRITLGAAYFSNEYENLIQYEFQTNKYRNISLAESRGVEVFSMLHPVRNVNLQINYTFTDAEDIKNNEPLLQRPKHKVKGIIGCTLLRRANISLENIYIGEKYDYPMVKMDAYNILNFAASYDIQMFRLFFRLDNVLDEEFEEVNGFGTAGLSWYAGLKFII